MRSGRSKTVTNCNKGKYSCKKIEPSKVNDGGSNSSLAAMRSGKERRWRSSELVQRPRNRSKKGWTSDTGEKPPKGGCGQDWPPQRGRGVREMRGRHGSRRGGWGRGGGFSARRATP